MRKVFLLVIVSLLLVVFAVAAEEKVENHGINTPGWEESISISADGQEIFFAYKAKDQVFADMGYDKEGPARLGNHGNNMDIYHAVRQEDGSWSEPVNLKIINTIKPEYAPNISADGKILLFVREEHQDKQVLYSTMRTQNGWTRPQAMPAPFNTIFGETTPYQTPDGSAIIFASRRIKVNRPWELWISVKNEEGLFLEPTIMASVNSKGNDWYPVVDPVSGDLYFISDREEGKARIYVAHKYEKNLWLKPEPLAVEWSADDIVSPSFDATGQHLFLGYFLKDVTGAGDIYCSQRQADNSWAAPVPLENINVLSPQTKEKQEGKDAN